MNLQRGEYPDFLASEIHDDVLVLKLTGKFFRNVVNLEKRDFLSEYFDKISKDPDIKTVIIHSSFQEFGNDDYLHFFLFECPKRKPDTSTIYSEADRYEAHKFCNVIDQIMLQIINLEKIVVHTCRGNTIPLLMNMGLACDYRIVADNTVFYNAYQEIGLIPKGAGPFFLSRRIGAGKVYELMLLNRRITAGQALELGIVDKVVPWQQLENEALQVARLFGENHGRTLSGMKKLVNYSVKDLRDYLAFESETFLRIMENEAFEDQ